MHQKEIYTVVCRTENTAKPNRNKTHKMPSQHNDKLREKKRTIAKCWNFAELSVEAYGSAVIGH